MLWAGMALTFVESLVLWGVPVVTILVTLGYYFYWGKEAEEVATGTQEPDSMTDGGEA